MHPYIESLPTDNSAHMNERVAMMTYIHVDLCIYIYADNCCIFLLYREELKQLRSEMFEIEKSLMAQVVLFYHVQIDIKAIDRLMIH